MLIKLKKLRESVSHIKIRTKLFFLIAITGICCFSSFRFFWHQKWNIYYFLTENLPSGMQIFPVPDEDFWMKLHAEAKKYNIPDSEEDTETVNALKPFFSLADQYTAIYIYGLKDGKYRAGRYPDITLWNEPFNTFFQFAYRWIDDDIDQVYERAVEFKNGYAYVMIYFYHSSFFFVPYGIFCLILCVSLFLAVILFFVGKKLKTVVCLEKSILQISSGDLDTPVPVSGSDEIGILASELDHLRLTLHENIQTEQNLHKSNQELIAALSHDLRTPLTILKGYLEIVRLNRNPDMQTEYVNRCLKKTEDIQELTGRMFEYALVYDAAGTEKDLQLTEISPDFFLESVKEHADFLQLAGFQTRLHLFGTPADSTVSFQDTSYIAADISMVKRVFNNLISNIIKYADKKEAVFISVSAGPTLTILLKNRIRNSQDCMESTQIGLQSSCRIMEQMNGTLSVWSDQEFFTAELNFPMYEKTPET